MWEVTSVPCFKRSLTSLFLSNSCIDVDDLNEPSHKQTKNVKVHIYPF